MHSSRAQFYADNAPQMHIMPICKQPIDRWAHLLPDCDLDWLTRLPATFTDIYVEEGVLVVSDGSVYVSFAPQHLTRFSVWTQDDVLYSTTCADDIIRFLNDCTPCGNTALQIQIREAESRLRALILRAVKAGIDVTVPAASNTLRPFDIIIPAREG